MDSAVSLLGCYVWVRMWIRGYFCVNAGDWTSDPSRQMCSVFLRAIGVCYSFSLQPTHDYHNKSLIAKELLPNVLSESKMRHNVEKKKEKNRAITRNKSKLQNAVEKMGNEEASERDQGDGGIVQAYGRPFSHHPPPPSNPPTHN